MKLWLAPLHGITYYYFRNVLCRHAEGIDAAIAPFVPIGAPGKVNINKWKDLLPENNKGLEVIPQLMGNVASDFLYTASLLYDSGYARINWNLGCPMKQIVKRKRGCGLMPYPDAVEEVVAQITSKSSVKLSLKIRLGLHSIEEGEELIKRMNAYPLDCIILHPRLGEWLYEGHADLDAFEYLLQLSEHEIYYNGDIVEPEAFLCLQERFPQIQNWMIGRGLLRNPFLAEQIKGSVYCSDLIECCGKRFVAYYRDLTETFIVVRGIRGTLSSLKELWHYFASFWNLSPAELTTLLRVNDFNDFLLKTNEIMFKKMNG